VCRDNVAQSGCERWAEAWSERAPKQ
jgi:hypothetical protein